MLIDYKGLLPSMSSVMEWVNAIECCERELLEWEAFDDMNSNLRCVMISTNQSQPPWNMATPAKSTLSNTPQTNDCTFPSGPHVPPKAKVPLEEITCYTCNKKGHYRGSKECPKMPSLACLHIMDVNADKEELQAPETEETPFKGVDYDGETDPETPITDYKGEEEGVGVIITSIHARDNISDNQILEDSKSILQLAALTASDLKEDETVANKIIQSVKEDYELRGSGIAPRPCGPMSKQIAKETRAQVKCGMLAHQRVYTPI
jgi:hypothetical protein